MTLAEAKLIVWQRKRRMELAADLLMLKSEGEQLRRINRVIGQANQSVPLSTKILCEYNGAPVHVRVISDRLGCVAGEVAKAAHDLCKQGRLRRVGHGIYEKVHFAGPHNHK